MNYMIYKDDDSIKDIPDEADRFWLSFQKSFNESRRFLNKELELLLKIDQVSIKLIDLMNRSEGNFIIENDTILFLYDDGLNQYNFLTGEINDCIFEIASSYDILEQRHDKMIDEFRSIKV